MRTYTIKELRQKNSNVNTPIRQVAAFLDWLEAQEERIINEEEYNEDGVGSEFDRIGDD